MLFRSRITGRFKKKVKFSTGGRVIILEKVKIVNPEGKVVFEERSKPYPFILGSQVTSVFGGAANRKEFALRHSNLKKKVKSHKTNATKENENINSLYLKIRKLRESEKKNLIVLGALTEEARDHYPKEWLIQLELLELYKKFQLSDELSSALEIGRAHV